MKPAAVGATPRDDGIGDENYPPIEEYDSIHNDLVNPGLIYFKAGVIDEINKEGQIVASTPMTIEENGTSSPSPKVFSQPSRALPRLFMARSRL